MTGALRHPQRVPHRVGGDVRNVDEHAQTVHLADHLLAELRQAAVLRARRSRESAQSSVSECVSVM